MEIPMNGNSIIKNFVSNRAVINDTEALKLGS